MTLDEKIRAAEQAAQELREALDVLAREAEAEIGEAPRAVTWLKEHAECLTFDGMRRAVAMARRPNGPAVTLEFSGSGREPVAAEAIRRTATQVVVLRRDWGSKESYRLADGEPVKRGSWYIRGTDLPKLREMPIGENEVSRALKAIEAGRYDAENGKGGDA